MNDALDMLRRAKAEKAAHEAALAEITSGSGGGDAGACRRILKGAEVDNVIGPLSTSETIAVALAFGRLDLLPGDYDNFRDAWQRLDTRQRRLVDTVARAPWRRG
ncbi:hypothetical protein [Pseudooceanicola nanhaiensis]|uniref:hypothetical protein n=1 Tax=Pseudooceanicola nanhaiensis TaxID=375761 RepID=UPI0035168486